MKDFVIKYWMQVGFGLTISAITYMFRKLMKRIKKHEDLGEGVKALLYDRLRQAHNYHLDNGFISIDEFNCFNQLYNSYHNLGGNGAGTEMLQRMKDLPPKKKESCND